MKYAGQLAVILAVTLAGEALHHFIPLPVPAGIYGMVLLLACLCLGLIKLRHVRDTALLLIELMPLMFIPAGVGLIDSFGVLRANLAAYAAITAVSTFAVMIVSGRVAQAVIRRRERRDD